jgi:hypothetical protein
VRVPVWEMPTRRFAVFVCSHVRSYAVLYCLFIRLYNYLTRSEIYLHNCLVGPLQLCDNVYNCNNRFCWP